MSPGKAYGNNGYKGVAGFVDVETTGLSPYYDEIIEVSFCLFTFSRGRGEIIGVKEEYTGLREPKRAISQGAARVHGITFQQVKGRCLDEKRIISMIHNAEFIIAHNANFDRSFLAKDFKEVKNKQWLCSMTGINWYQKGFKSKSLQYLINAHNIKVARSHRAEDDVRAALKLLSTSTPLGRSYFYELLQNQLPSALEWGA